MKGKRTSILVAAGGVAVLLLGYMVLIRPVGSKIDAAKKQTEEAISEESNLRLKLRQLQQAQQNAPEIAARLAKFNLLLPRTSDLPTFIRQVQTAADESGVNLNSIAPSPPTPIQSGPGIDPSLAGKGLFALNVVLNVEGGFFRLRAFIGRLEGLQRVVTLNNLSITPGVGDGEVSTLTSTISMQMFLVNPTSPLPGSGSTGSPRPTPAPTGGGGPGGPATPAPTTR